MFLRFAGFWSDGSRTPTSDGPRRRGPDGRTRRDTCTFSSFPPVRGTATPSPTRHQGGGCRRHGRTRRYGARSRRCGMGHSRRHDLPGLWAVAGEGGGGGGAVGGESGSSIFSTPTCTLPFRALPPATHPDGPLTTPGPPALGVNRTAYATAPPQDQDPRELGDLN